MRPESMVVDGESDMAKFVPIHSSVQNPFNRERHLYSRRDFKLNRSIALDE